MYQVEVVLAVLASLLVIGLYHTSLTQIITEVFDRIRQLVILPRDCLRDVAASLATWCQQFRQNEDIEEPNRFSSFLVGALLFVPFLMVFVYADYHLIMLTLSAMGGMGSGVIESGETSVGVLPLLPVSPEVVTGLSLVSVGVYWGFVLTDILGKTHFAPWNRLSETWVHRLQIIAGINIALAILLGSLMGVYRGLAQVEDFSTVPELGMETVDILPDEVYPGESVLSFGGDSVGAAASSTASLPEFVVPTWQKVLTVIVMGALPILIMVSAICAAWCLYMLPMYLNYGAIVLLRIIALIAAMPFEILRHVVEFVWGVFRSIFQFVARISVQLALPIGRLLGPGRTDVDIPVVPERVGETVPKQPRDMLVSGRENAMQDVGSGGSTVGGSGDTEDRQDSIIEVSVDEPDTQTKNWAPYQ